MKRWVERTEQAGRLHQRNTRGASKSDLPVMADAQPIYGGGNFVDLTLKVKVIQEAGTLLAHRPDFPHGSTQLCGAHSLGTTIPFTERTLRAFRARSGGDTD